MRRRKKLIEVALPLEAIKQGQRAGLAIRMGATKGYVSQVLSGSHNMTLRTLSDICFALGKKPAITMMEAETDAGAARAAELF